MVLDDEYLKLGLYNLSKSLNVEDVIRSWILMGPSTFDKVSIISLESYDRGVYPKKLNNLIDSSESHFIPYFYSDKLYFIDNELLAETFSNQEKDTLFSVDYSIMLDTNYASYIDNFVRNDWANLSNEVFNAIDLLIREEFHFDYIFYMIENFKNSFLNSDELDLNIVKEKKTKLYQNLFSLELFKSIDREEYINSGKLKYSISENEAKLLADQIFNGIFYSNDAKEKMDYLLSVQRYMVLFIIGVMQIKFGTKTTLKRKIQKLFDYLNNIVGIYFDREMVIAYEYFKDQKNVKILNKINKGINSTKLLQIIENIAWDFSVPRIMERQLVVGGGR